MSVPNSSVDLDRGVYAAYERIRSQEANSTSKQSIDEAGQEAVGEEQHLTDESGNVEDVDVVVDAVDEDPDARCSAEEERLPPPLVILKIRVSKWIWSNAIRVKLTSEQS